MLQVHHLSLQLVLQHIHQGQLISQLLRHTAFKQFILKLQHLALNLQLLMLYPSHVLSHSSHKVQRVLLGFYETEKQKIVHNLEQEKKCIVHLYLTLIILNTQTKTLSKANKTLKSPSKSNIKKASI